MLRVHYRHDNITKGFDFRSRSVLQAKSQMSFLLPNDRRQGTEGTAKTQKNTTTYYIRQILAERFVTSGEKEEPNNCSEPRSTLEVGRT